MLVALPVAALSGGVSVPSAQELPVPCGACAGVPNFVTSGAATYSTSGTVGTIRQTTDRATLNWKSFNIGAGNTVNFRQPSSTSAALNRIHQGDPSRILGNLNANGQVYLINQNGIVFGSGAQVNTRALTASTLNVSDEVFDTYGITGAINQPAGDKAAAKAAFEGESKGAIRVEAGARLRAGERVMLIGQEVENRGTIETPDGQAILAGSHDKVYIATDNQLGGWLVEVDTGGSVTNLGEIIAERGNASLVGLAVNQSGRVRATTSVNRNGSIRLMAQDGARPVNFLDPAGNEGRKPTATRTGTLTFGAGSVTEVQPDRTSNATATDGQAQPQSRVDAVAKSIRVKENAKVLAPGGKVAMTATANALQPTTGSDAGNRIHVARGAVIDVSGDRSAVVPMERNQGSIKLFGNELADAPAQRSGPLARQEIFLDLRKGSTITDVTPLLERVQRGVGERLASGGDVTLSALGGDVVLQSGATIAFAGGQVRYLDGYIGTTKLVTTDGRIVDIGVADPRQAYAGIWGQMVVDHRKWGVTEVFGFGSGGAMAEFNPGYVEGRDAGSLAVIAANASLGGVLRGDAVRGRLQREPAAGTAVGLYRPFTQAPLQGALDISGIRGSVRFADALSVADYGFADPIPADLVLSTELFRGTGINRLALQAGGEQLTVPRNVTLVLDPGGELSLSGREVVIDGGIRAQGGKVEINTALGGRVELGNTGSIDASGQWVNDGVAVNGGSTGTAPLFIDGGTVSIAAQGDLVLGAGSRIDVSGGAQLGSDGEVRAGAAGSIELESRIPGVATATALELGGTLAGYGLNQGGSVTLRAAEFRVGAGTASGNAGVVTLSPSFFGRNGIAEYNLIADRGGIVVADDAQLLIRPEYRQLTGDYANQRTGAALSEFAREVILPDYARGTSSFTATVARVAGYTDTGARVSVGRGARIETEIGGAIALSADTDIQVNGSLIAPAGDISLTLRLPDAGNDTGFRADQAIRLGAGARLSARGAAKVVTNALGHREGEVLSGGEVLLEARRGHVFTETGSRIDVSGISRALDVPNGEVLPPAAVTVASDAGSIRIQSAEGGVLGGTLMARPGGPTADGGSFLARVDTQVRDPNGTIFNDPTKRQFPTRTPEVILGAGRDDHPALGQDAPADVTGRLFVDLADLGAGGFTAADFAASWRYAGNLPVSPGAISIEGGAGLSLARRIGLDADAINLGAGAANLSAAYVALGPTHDVGRNTAAPAAGAGTLTVDAQHVDLTGTFVVNGLIATGSAPALHIRSAGDIRAVGTRRSSDTLSDNPGGLTAAGNIRLSAAQVYPSTLSDYHIGVTRSDGSIAIDRTGTAPVPLSAAGALRLSAANIDQGGVLRAPFGDILLEAGDGLRLGAGSITSTSGAGVVVPFGILQIGQDWVYPLRNFTSVLEDAPAKTITLRAPDIDIARGATVDLRGGGDLLAYEFVKGPGGSRDILPGDNPEGAFAILPGRAGQYGFIDPYESPSAGIEVGSTITLAAGGGVAAGEYAVLPARYALLPGAYLITPLPGTQKIQPGVRQTLSDGATAIVAGKRSKAGTNAEAAQWSGYTIENGEQVRQRAEFNEQLASRYFKAEGGGVPGDAGRLTVDASRSIRLDGSLAAAAAAGGRGAEVDFVGDNLAVVTERTASGVRVELVDEELSRLGAASLLLGGGRQTDGATSALDVRARSVSVERGAVVTAPEVVLAARETIQIQAGARVSGAGSGAGLGTTEYTVSGNGAFARVSAGAQASVLRNGAGSSSGRVQIQEGATLQADGAINLEASGDVTSAGDLLVEGGSLSLTASLISLGDAGGVTGGLVLSSADLARFRARELLLNSASTIDLYGPIDTTLDTVRFDAAGLRGFDNTGAKAAVNAGDLVLSNRRGGSVASIGTGTGVLDIHVRNLTLGGGTVDVSGFGEVRLTAAGQLAAEGAAGLAARGDLAVAASRITTGTGADATISATGALTTSALAAPAGQAPVTALGGRLRMSADTITHASRIELPSGIVTLQAAGPGDVTLRSGSSIDVGGRDVAVADLVVGSPGGTVSLLADQGNVTVQDGAVVSVAGAPSGGDAGQLTVRALNGDVDVAAGATLNGAAVAGACQGAFDVSTRTLTGGFSSLNEQLNAGGFTERRALRLRSGSVTIGADEVVNAKEFALAIDGGGIDLAGGINAAAKRGGRVVLSARDDVILRTSGYIDARATGAGETGGEVDLRTTSGTIDLRSAIDVSGRDADGQANDTGSVRVRAPRVGSNGVGIASLSGDIDGADRVDLEAVRVYGNFGNVNTSSLATVFTDSAAYMANGAAIESALGVAGDGRYHLLPGVELRSAGNMTVGTVDLLSRRYGAEAGVLTLRAAGDLTVSGALSDGVRTESIAGEPAREVVQGGDSWSYRLVAGSDAASADVMATTGSAGSVLVNAPVRTGTGRIEVAAAGDVRLQSAVYTTGRNRGTGALDPVDVEKLVRGDFVEGGGAIRVRAGGDVRGTVGAALPDWLVRFAGVNELYNLFYGKPEGFRMPAGWAIDVSRFSNGVGALGGGDVVVEADGKMSLMNLALPTNGLPEAADGTALNVAGGGHLDVRVAGDIRDSSFLLGSGEGEVRAGGAITGTTATGGGVVLQLADARVGLQARTGVEVDAAYNFTAAPSDPNFLIDGFIPVVPDSFLTYAEDSGVWLRTIAGPAVVSGEGAAIAQGNGRPDSTGLMGLYPGSLRAQSLQGDVVIKETINLMPSARGQLELLAGADVEGNGRIVLPDSDVQLLPGVLNPSGSFTDLDLARILTGHAPVPLHAQDELPARIVAVAGSVGPRTEFEALRFDIAKQTRVFACVDVSNLRIGIQHARGGDISVIEAGRDIAYPTIRQTNGSLQDVRGSPVEVAGPGRLDLLAGRDVDLGLSDGVLTTGNTANPALPEGGADISIWTGRAGKPDIRAFIDRYLTRPEYAAALAAYMARLPRDPQRTDVENFRALPEYRQRELLQSVFFTELRESGIAATEAGNDFSRGFEAIRTLFPGERRYEGDFEAFLSRVSTLDGGDIELLVPGGLVNAGVASAAGVEKSADRLGVVVQREGDINAFVRDDFLVNASRVFALDGGDVTIWSSEADIDAGRGAKAALSIPPPTVSFDANGNVVIEFPAAISGSGIRTAVSTAGRTPGDVFLFAPSGVVNAGDAGIESAGNITVAAVQVIGADNISVAGTSVGVPTVSAGSLAAGLTGVGDVAAAATKSVTEGVASADAADAEQAAQEAAESMAAALSFISVEFLGYGEG